MRDTGILKRLDPGSIAIRASSRSFVIREAGNDRGAWSEYDYVIVLFFFSQEKSISNDRY